MASSFSYCKTTAVSVQGSSSAEDSIGPAHFNLAALRNGSPGKWDFWEKRCSFCIKYGTPWLNIIECNGKVLRVAHLWFFKANDHLKRKGVQTNQIHTHPYGIFIKINTKWTRIGVMVHNLWNWLFIWLDIRTRRRKSVVTWSLESGPDVVYHLDCERTLVLLAFGWLRLIDMECMINNAFSLSTSIRTCIIACIARVDDDFPGNDLSNRTQIIFAL